MDKRYFCESCGYKWESKKKFGEPSQCPSCKKDNITKYSGTEKYKEDVILENERRAKNKEKIKKLKQQLQKERQKVEKEYNIKKEEDKSQMFFVLVLISFAGGFYFWYSFLIFGASLIIWVYYYNLVKKYKSKIAEQTYDLQYELDELEEEEYEDEDIFDR